MKSGVSFKKDAVTVAGEKYYFAAFPPRTSATDPVTVEATLTNPTGESVTVPVTWSLYHWSQNDQANFITSKTEQVTIAAGKTAKVSFVVDDANHPVYFLQGVAKWHDFSSIINIRFVREGKDQLRINYPSLMSYPLTEGQESTLFSCLHNAGESASVPNGRLELSACSTQSSRRLTAAHLRADVTKGLQRPAKIRAHRICAPGHVFPVRHACPSRSHSSLTPVFLPRFGRGPTSSRRRSRWRRSAVHEVRER